MLQGQGLHSGIQQQFCQDKQRGKLSASSKGNQKYVLHNNCIYVRVFVLTVASAFVRAQLHEVRTGTRERLIVVDKT